MNRQRGVTLLETMVAIAIMGIVIAWGIPSLSDVISNNTVKSTADVVFSALQEARSEALKRNTAVSATITATAINLSGSNYAKTISLAGAGSGTTISQSTAGAITFTSTGQIVASTSYTITIINTSCAANNACLNVEAYGGGFIKVCNPSQGNSNASNFCPSSS
ncbi:pilus assembly FimT family protein [Pseudomonas batumici]|uniref:pilus assembly FimT family protein n=1 Tax=Pseudomonas batumici TaxID=226910 RepID=UPI000A000087|nr:GspH/FimT family pseudopilin [Pseudomonas batumici]